MPTSPAHDQQRPTGSQADPRVQELAEQLVALAGNPLLRALAAAATVTAAPDPATGPPAAPVVPSSPPELRQLVDASMTSAFGHPPRRDADGDIPIRTEHTTVYVRVLDPAPIVRIFAVLAEAVPSPQLLQRINTLNTGLLCARVIHTGEQVQLALDLLADPYAEAQLHWAVGEVASVADQLLDDGGGLGTPAAPEPPTGFYL